MAEAAPPKKLSLTLAECKAFLEGWVGMSTIANQPADEVDVSTNFCCSKCHSNPLKKASSDLDQIRRDNQKQKIPKYQSKKTRILQRLKRISANFRIVYVDCGHSYCCKCITSLKESSFICIIPGCGKNVTTAVTSSVMMESNTALCYVDAVVQRCSSGDLECPKKGNCLWKELCPYQHEDQSIPVVRRRDTACHETLLKGNLFFNLHLWEFSNCNGYQSQIVRHEPKTIADDSVVRIYETFIVENDFAWYHVMKFFVDFLGRPPAFANPQLLFHENLSGTLVSMAWHMETNYIRPPTIEVLHQVVSSAVPTYNEHGERYGLQEVHLTWLSALNLIS